jgi:uncharacterized membrane protein
MSIEPKQSKPKQPEQVESLEHDDSTVLKHMDMLQTIITRMAANSAACKRWAIVLVAAMLAFAVKGGQYSLLCIALLPVLVFYCLDAYLPNAGKSFSRGI